MPTKFERDYVILEEITFECPARVAAIVYAAYIEDHLAGLIKLKMPGLTSALSERIFRPSEGALGSLARKIDLACALGVLTGEEGKAAITIARIRNRFAHKLEVLSFDHKEVAQLVDSLPSTYRLPKRDGTFVTFTAESRKERFNVAAMGLCRTIVEAHSGKEVDFIALADELSPSPARSWKPSRNRPETLDPGDQ